MMPRHEWIRKTLVLGSGAVKIGEAAEFDYSGSQCLKALREEGIEIVLVNPNIATIQTDPKDGVKIYLLPITPEYVERVIRKERPDSILLSFGGQTALNCGVLLSKAGKLEKYGVKVLGTPIRTIQETEDRELFKQAMGRSETPVPKSISANSVNECLNAAQRVGYPVIIRVAFTLGGKGSAIVWNEEQMHRVAEPALAQSVIRQVLVEEYLHHWKEIEYEVVRDAADNCITVCNMENFDPMGIHTGDSIVIAPSQTLTNREYHKLRAASINAIRSLGVVGECNIQWALDPNSEEIRAIEVNARMSRSSALASKATGYPLAYIAAKLALGYNLPELWNKITNITTACFEPALDYCVVKIPRWDLEKFRNIDPHLGPQMKSVGEVMGIGRTFEEALQKAVRMLDIGKLGLVCNPEEQHYTMEEIRDALKHPTDERLYFIMRGLQNGLTISEIHELTGVDPWFIHKLENVIETEHALRRITLVDEIAAALIRHAKELGFSDQQIAVCVKTDEFSIREFRENNHISPVVKQIDTLAAEWPARTNYLYMTYGGEDDDEIEFQSRKKVIVLGSGVFRIGSSVEFDWSAVNTVMALKENGIEETILVNYNPETVSTDYDCCDKLYFEELTLERILDIYEKEMPHGIVVCVGGQIANNLAPKLAKHGVHILGSTSRTIDLAEDRSKFSSLLDKLAIPQPQWRKATSISACKSFAKQFGYPVLVRPSYVLSGSAMRVADNEEQLERYLRLAVSVSHEHPVVISKFMLDAREVEVDGVCDGTNVMLSPIMEHIENAGIHSGDATISLPPKTLSNSIMEKVRDYSNKIAVGLGIRGPFNIQYLAKGDMVYVIECNARASRSMPYVSKSTGTNIIRTAVPIILGKRKLNPETTKPADPSYFSVKIPQFSFVRLHGADPVSGVEMMSTGEVACLGRNFSDAFAKALEATEISLPSKGGVLITVGGRELKNRIVPLSVALASLGFEIYATEHTALTLHEAGLRKVVALNKIREASKKPNILDYLLNRKISLVINIPTNGASAVDQEILADEYAIRRLAVEHNIPVVTTIELASAIVEALQYLSFQEPEILALTDYTKP
jgi:carbamoyl-phosphate synthase large subunit